MTPFDEVYRDHADAVYRFCVSQLRDQATAEDVTGDVFAAAFAAYERVRPDRRRAHLAVPDRPQRRDRPVPP